jgi:GNAT acetyltransferase-like protein
MDAGYPDRFMELFERRGEAATVVRGAIFKPYSGMVVPFGPADADYSLSDDEASRALRSLGGTVLRTTTGFRPAAAVDDWYAVICRSFSPVDSVSSSNTRSKLRRALRNCEVRRISADEVATAGYEVYRRAFERYTGPDSPVARDRFEPHHVVTGDFDDIVEHWGVYCDGELAGYASNYVFGNTEAAYSTLKFHPDHLRKYSSYALFHRMNEHYLGEGRVSYVNDGFRSILHGTELQPFLEHNFAFEKAYVGIDAFYRQPYRAILRATFPFRGLIGRVDDRARAMYELERVVRAGRMQA